MSNETRTAAHAAIDRASPENLAQTAHNVVEDLCGVIDAIARQAAAQTHSYINQARRGAKFVGPDYPACNPPPSTSPPPSKETEDELLQARQVKALEQIAKSLNQIQHSFPSDIDGSALNVMLYKGEKP